MSNIFSFRTTHVVGVLVLVLFVSQSRDCSSTPPEYKAFYSQSWDSQRQEAKGFPIEKQIDYYLAGRRYFHPPYSTLLYVIADQGKEAVPLLMEKMKRTDSDSARMDLLEVVLNIDEFHADLSNDKQVIDELTGVVGRMTDTQRKPEAQAMLKEIIENRRP